MTIILQAKKREPGKRSTLTQLRKDGLLAAVIYGYQTESMPISLEYKQTAKAVQKNGYTSVFKIEIEGKQVDAVLTDIQRDALKGHVKHVDFLAINMTEELEVDVPITLVGTSIGIKEGGVLTQPSHTVKVKVKPSDIPDSIEVDVSQLAVGETLVVGNVRNQFLNLTILQEDDYTLATVTPSAATAEENIDPTDEEINAKASGE